MKRLFSIAIITLLSFSACHSNESASVKSTENIVTEAAAAEVDVSSNISDMQLSMPEPPEEINRRVEANTPRQIIKTATIRMQVADAEKSHSAIQQLTKSQNAYFGRDERTQTNGEISYNTTIRVAAQHFDTLTDLILKEAIFINTKEINADDVTSEYVDVVARLRNKKELEQRYIQLLKQASKVTDMLEIERNLQTIREEIEATEARLKTMKDQVAYSTIQLSFYQQLPQADQPGYSFGYKLWQALKNGWYGLGDFFLGIVSIWPFLLLFSAAIYLFLRWRKAKKAKNTGINP